MIGTSFAWVTSSLVTLPHVPGGTPTTKLAYVGAAVTYFTFAVGALVCNWLPEPPEETCLEQ